MKADNNFNKINAKSNTENRGKHDFDELSKKIIGAAIEVHREL